MRLVTLGAVLFWNDMSQNRTYFGNYCGRARFGSTSSLDGLPALRIFFTWRTHEVLCQSRGRCVAVVSEEQYFLKVHSGSE